MIAKNDQWIINIFHNRPTYLAILPIRNCPCLISYPLLVELESGFPSPPLSPSTLAPLKSEQTLSSLSWPEQDMFPGRILPHCCYVLLSSLTCPHLFFFKKKFLSLFFFWSFIHMCIHCLGHFSTLPHSPTLLPPFSVSGRSCSALITDFVEEKTYA
jgi:hypothetical protein